MLLTCALAQQLVQPVLGISLQQIKLHLGHLIVQTLHSTMQEGSRTLLLLHFCSAQCISVSA